MSLEQDIFDEIDNLNLKEAACLLADIEGYKQPLVDINQFITDPDYLGSMFLVEGKMKLFSIWVDALNQIFPNPYYSPYYECAFSGSIGAGKSTCGRIVLLYDLYKLLMLKDPFLKYSLIASDAIVLALFTANLNLARTVLYKPF